MKVIKKYERLYSDSDLEQKLVITETYLTSSRTEMDKFEEYCRKCIGEEAIENIDYFKMR